MMQDRASQTERQDSKILTVRVGQLTSYVPMILQHPWTCYVRSTSPRCSSCYPRQKRRHTMRLFITPADSDAAAAVRAADNDDSVEDAQDRAASLSDCLL